mgnify:FL=1
MDGSWVEGSNEPDVEKLAADWLSHKAAEKAAKELRIETEVKILPFLESKSRGSKTTTLPNGIKVTVKNEIRRSIDWDQWKLIKDKIPEELHPVKLVEAFDEPKFLEILERKPEMARTFAQAVTTKQAKPNVQVKEGRSE